jgi:DNA-binding transcriptional ArsR family regulator
MPTYSTDPFYALADPNRRAILMLIRKEKRSINTLATHFEVSRPAVSKHIKVLHEAGFLHYEDVGRERFCGLNPDGFNGVKEWVEHFEQFWETKVHNLEQLLKKRANQKNKKK